MTVYNEAKQSKKDKGCSDCPPQLCHWDDSPNRKGQGHRSRNSERVTYSKWQKRAKHSTALALLHAECNGEQPSHPGIDAVKSTQPKQGGPGDRFIHSSPHEKQYESEDASPPSR
jgi:hypothetical protein